MKASIVDLRYKMKDVLKALDRNESVTVFHRGKARGRLVPAGAEKRLRVEDHSFFGSARGDRRSVERVIDDLRRTRVARRG
jgi:antitoxin (DNA-binding transcriptional repressor) of toxin-antitoxin stability system